MDGSEPNCLVPNGVSITHHRSNELQEVGLQGLPLHLCELGFAGHRAALFRPLFLEEIEVRDADFGKGRELVERVFNVRDPVVRVQVDEIAKLAVDGPFEQAIAILELDAEDGMCVVERVYRVGDA